MQTNIKIAGVYFLFVKGNDNKCKIGFSGNCKKRLFTHHTSSPDSYYYKIIKTDEYKAMEKQIHEMYSAKRWKLEWFNITKEDVDSLILALGFTGDFICVKTDNAEEINTNDVSNVEETRAEETDLKDANNADETVSPCETPETINNKAFPCPKCDRVFKAKHHLDTHLRAKTPCDRVLSCPRCEITFKRSYEYERHMKRTRPCVPPVTKNANINENDTNEMDATCKYCKYVFSSKSNMKRHLPICKSVDIIELLQEQLQEQSARIEQLENRQNNHAT